MNKVIVAKPIADTYTQVEVQEILTLALAQKNDSAEPRLRQREIEFSQQQLAEIASDLNISIDLIQAAERDWLIDRTQKQTDRHRRMKLQKSLGRYIIVNSVLIILNALTNPLAFLGLSWSLLVLFSWGIFLALKAWCLISRSRSN